MFGLNIILLGFEAAMSGLLILVFGLYAFLNDFVNIILC